MPFRKNKNAATEKPEQPARDAASDATAAGGRLSGDRLSYNATLIQLGIEAGPDPLANDLLRRVMHAIHDWMVSNHIDGLPPQIAFQQALSMLNAIDRSAFPKDPP